MAHSKRITFSPLGTLSLTVQGFYYVITGAWPVIHRSSFEAVTGTKAEYWLVVMVGLLAVVIGIALLLAVHQTYVARATWFLALGAAVAFLVVDLWYVAGVVIPRIYLADAFAECAFILGILIGRTQARKV